MTKGIRKKSASVRECKALNRQNFMSDLLRQSEKWPEAFPHDGINRQRYRFLNAID
ncbi:hypothetical cytosolic protein [Syntrophus aciditrophicus SB]|uniref:Hypothetical cytosolic protein n=1 Tax=Syntrophus aciditrophicus (strain SB) TaxID=56780 RepID=Q2LRL3_SYNAS|nr:hypothetical cytosolic protein [Syntrophus aciditrophicus SB]